MLSEGVWFGSSLLIDYQLESEEGRSSGPSFCPRGVDRASLSISDKGSFLILSQLGMAPSQLVHSLIKPYVAGIPGNTAVNQNPAV